MLKGSIVALITPFQENGDVDLQTLKKLVEWHVEQGTDGIVCCGTTGEAPTLSDEEQFAIFKTVIETARKRLKVIAGTGTYNTRHTVERTREALKLGADGALVVMPYYSRPTFEGCLAHFTEVARVGLPTIIYYHPGRTGVRLTAEQLGAIGALPSMAGIKEASGTTDFIHLLKQQTHLPIYSGDDTLALDHLKAGAQGVISIVANLIPQEWKEMIHAFLRGDQDRSQEIFKQLRPLCESLVIETNPQGVKYAASLLGRTTPYLRLPLVQPRESTQEAIKQALLLHELNGPSLG